MTMRIELGRAGDQAGEDERPLSDPAADLQVARDFIRLARHFNVLAVELRLWNDEELDGADEGESYEGEKEEGEVVAFLGIAPGILLSWFSVNAESEAAGVVRAELQPMRALSEVFRSSPQSAKGTTLNVAHLTAGALETIQRTAWKAKDDLGALRTALVADEDEDEGEDDF